MNKNIYDFQTTNNTIIHCCKYNSNNKFFATGESNGKILIFKNEKDEEFKKIYEKKIHEYSIFDIAWSHPKFGVYLASVSYDKKVIIISYQKDNYWIQCYEYIHENSVNCCEFSPYEYGLILI